MADIEIHLERQASALAPTDAQTAAAARSHGYLRDVLSTGNMGGRIQASYLSGSYARHTAIRPLDDVDVIFEIDPRQWKRSALEQLLYTLPGPEQVLETFARAIRYRYPNSSVRTQRRSVGLVMEHLQIDIVPAVVHDQRAQWLYVPDRASATWIESAPALHEAVATDVNKKCAARFKPLVRLLKGWNGSLPTTASQKSFAVETIAARVLDAYPQTTLAGGMFVFFDFLAWRSGHASTIGWRDSLDIHLGGWSGASLPDIAGTGANILAGTEVESLVKFGAAARLMRDLLVDVQSARDPANAWARLEPRLRGGLGRL